MLKKLMLTTALSAALATAAFAQETGIPNLVLNHFSPRYQQAGSGPSMADVEAEARAALAVLQRDPGPAGGRHRVAGPGIEGGIRVPEQAGITGQ